MHGGYVGNSIGTMHGGYVGKDNPFTKIGSSETIYVDKTVITIRRYSIDDGPIDAVHK